MLRYRFIIKVLVVGAILNLINIHSAISQILFNEVSSSNTTGITDPDFGSNSDWIELYNAGEEPIDIGGYFLSDDFILVDKWQVPEGTVVAPKGFLLIWLDDENVGLHTNFKLSSDGEIVFLSDRDRNTVDIFEYSNQLTDLTYSRYPDGGNEWLENVSPSPGEPNVSFAYVGKLPKPTLSLEPGFYSSSKTLTLNVDNADAKIKYTTDGSTPTESSQTYTEPIDISSTKIIKAIAVGEKYVSSDLVVGTYFVDERNIDLPVVSIATNRANLFDDEIGIYVKGSNGVTGHCMEYPVNWNQDWERPATVEVFEENKQRVIGQEAGIKVMGGCSRQFSQKSLSVIARKEYGKKTFEHKMFNDRDYDEMQSFVLRNSGNDWGESMMRDAFMQAIVKGQMDLDWQAYRPSVVFLNGDYWGIHNIRERLNEYYVANIHPSVDPDNIDFIKRTNEVPTELKEGDLENFNALVDFLENNDISIKENYDYIKTQIDVVEYANYMAVQIYIANDDWPSNNVRMWRPKEENGRWRWILFDTDFGFGIWGRSVYRNTLEMCLEPHGPDYPNPPWATLFFRKLCENDEFVSLFCNTMLTHINTTWEPNRVASIGNSMKSKIANEFPYHKDRWGNGNLDGTVSSMISFNEERGPIMISHLEERFGKVEPPKEYTISVLGKGEVLVDGAVITKSSDIAYFNDEPMTLTASSYPGYRFVDWRKVDEIVNVKSIVSKQDTWKYFYDDDIPADNWMSSSYDDSGWESGQGKFGYNTDIANDGYNTVLDWGDDEWGKYTTAYFRKEVTLSNVNEFPEYSMKILRDDGYVVYVNGQEVGRENMPDGTVGYETVALASIPDPDTWAGYTIPSSMLKEGTNVIAVEMHQSEVGSKDITFDMEFGAKGSEPVGTTLSSSQVFDYVPSEGFTITAYFQEIEPVEGLVVNEFMASNGSSLADEEGEFEDWFEIKNTTDKPIDIGGLYLSNSPEYKDQYLVPTTNPELTTIQPGEYLVVWADDDNKQGVLHTNFKLSAGGGVIGIYQICADGFVAIDEISYEQQEEDMAFGRFPESSSNMKVLAATPGKKNKEISIITNVFINEFMTSNNGTVADENGNFSDWIELYNANDYPVDIGGLIITDSLADKTTRISVASPELTTIPAKGHILLWADKSPELGPLHLPFSLSADGEDIGLFQYNGVRYLTLNSFSYKTIRKDFSQGRASDGSSEWVQFAYPTPGASNKAIVPEPISNVFINEIASVNNSLKDNAGETEDWIELYNANDFPVNVGGLFITDTTGDPFVCRIPAAQPDSTTIPAKGYITFWADKDINQGVKHIGVKFDGKGEFVGLVQATTTKDFKYLDSLTVKSNGSSLTYGCYPDGSQQKKITSPTFNKANKDVDPLTLNVTLLTEFDTLFFVLDSDHSTYEFVLDSKVRVLPTVKVEPVLGNTKVEISQALSITNGVINVKAIHDETAEYKIYISKVLNTDASLSNISVSSGILYPEFDPNVYEYDVEVDYIDGKPPIVSAVANNDFATLFIQQPMSVPGTSSVTVTAEDGSQEVYTITLEPKPIDIVPLESNWKYYDKGIIAYTNWVQLDYDDSEWNEGKARLGYSAGNEDKEVTVLSYGDDEMNKIPIYYFRKTFTLNDFSNIEAAKLLLTRDDGAVVYLNGVEIARSNMPESSSVAEYDTVIQETEIYDYDTTFNSETVLKIDTIISRDTIVTRDTTFIEETVYVYDTTTVTDTVITGDGEFEVVEIVTREVIDSTAVVTLDTIVEEDVVITADTVINRETVVIVDTIVDIDTTVVVDTIVKIEIDNPYADTRVDGEFESKLFGFDIDPSLFVKGENIIAVETHQHDQESNDMGFDASISLTRSMAAEMETSSIDLKAGLNFISFNMYMENMAPEAVFAGIDDKIVSVKTDNGFYIPNNGEMNSMKTVEIGKAYFVEVTEDCTIRLEGFTADPSSFVYFLKPGMNYLGYIGTAPLSLRVAFESLGSNLIEVKNLHEYFNNTYSLYFNTLKLVEPHKAYMVRVNNTMRFSFP